MKWSANLSVGPTPIGGPSSHGPKTARLTEGSRHRGPGWLPVGLSRCRKGRQRASTRDAHGVRGSPGTAGSAALGPFPPFPQRSGQPS